MEPKPLELIDVTRSSCSDRIGFAKLTKMAFDGIDLLPLMRNLMEKVSRGTASAGEGLDLSLIAQLLGNKRAGLDIQSEVLSFHRLFRSPCASEKPKLRVLALAAAMDMGGNTPIEFLLEESGIELTTLYVVPGAALPAPLPDHDVAIVIASDSEECRDALDQIDQAVPLWPRPLLNLPRLVGNLDRDKLCRLLSDVAGLDIPETTIATRVQLSKARDDLMRDLAFPIIIRPRGSHAGVGLAKIDDLSAIDGYLAQRPEQEFFVSRFVDYSSRDGQFRKYRIVIVDGRSYACHMAIADHWNIWYLNAGMSFDDDKRREEEDFMRAFHSGFAVRHRRALAAMVDRIGLDYFTVDCAENKNGELLIFEVDNTAVVHNMDSPGIFPYKPPHMRMIFEAFAAMLYRHARRHRECAA